MNLAERLGIEIRYSDEGHSGLCTLRGNRVLFIDKSLDDKERIALFVHEFKTLDLVGYFVVPVIRKLLGVGDEGVDW